MEFGRTCESPAPVISLTILDQATLEYDQISKTTRLLAVVRDPKSNDTHPNVVSVPTQRVPVSLYNEILEPAKREQALKHAIWYNSPAIDNDLGSGHNPIVYAVEALLSRKLGLAEHLESGALRFQAALRLEKAGKSHHAGHSTSEQVEYISMANIIVATSDGTRLFPRRTASFLIYFGWKSGDSSTQ
jgi:hypothetical protein